MTTPSLGPIAASLPSFDVVDPAGRRRRVHPGGDADNVTDLAVALGCPDGHGITIDGQPVAPARRLSAIPELVDGAHVRRERTTSAPRSVPHREADRKCGSSGSDGGIEVAIVAGPACRGWMPLAVGRHGLGRSPYATIRVADPLVEVHHAVLAIDDEGSISLTQLTGRVPILVLRASEHSVGTAPAAEPVGASTRLVPGDALLVGSSRIELRWRLARATDDTIAVPIDERSSDPTHWRGTIAPIPGDPWRLEVRRTPAGPPDPPEPALVHPSGETRFDMPAATALVGAATAVVGALVIAGLLNQTMFAVFAAVGAIASGATWAVGALVVCRRRRSARRSCRLDRERFVTQARERQPAMLLRHRRRYVGIAGVLTVLESDRSSVWHRRPTDGDLEVVIGRGSCRSASASDPTDRTVVDADVTAVVEACAVVHDVDVPIRLHTAEAIAVRGDSERVRALLRSMLVQAGAAVGPADLRIVVIGEPARWEWVEWLPHARPQHGGGLVTPADIDRLGELPVPSDALAHTPPSTASGTPATLLIIDEPSLLAVRTGPLRRYMVASGATTVVAINADATSPVVCQRTLTISSFGGAEWGERSGGPGSSLGVLVAGIDAATACAAARALSPLVDPEVGGDGDERLPEQTTLSALDLVGAGAGADDVVQRWRAAGADPSLRAPIGVSIDGVIEVDLVADGPHALVAGTTGSGKSELLRTLVVSMASRVSPEHLTFVLIDYKGGSTFDSCADLPHTVGSVTDLDEGLAGRALVSLEAELARRERMLRAECVGDLTEYRRCAHVEPIPRLVVVIDEFATLAHDLPDFLRALVAIAQRGRSLGVHVVLATQRPAGVVTDDIRANTDLRLALRVNDASEARDVVGDDRPAAFPKSVPGRALLRLATDAPIVFQAARCTGPVSAGARRLRVANPAASGTADIAASLHAAGSGTDRGSELLAAVAAIQEASAILGLESPRRPWLDALPAIVDHAAVDVTVNGTVAAGTVVETVAATRDPIPALVPHDAVGVVDDPANQRRSPLRWDHTAGNLALLGSLGSGRTSTIVALATALCRTSTPERCHVYVIDGDGDRSLDALSSVAHCGVVVRVGEVERIDRLLRRLVEEIDRRSVGADELAAFPRVVLFIDGLPELRRSLDGVERLASLGMLDRILDAGPTVAVTSCVTCGAGALPSTVATAERWVFRIDDPDEARMGGRRGPATVADVPGRLRIASSGLDAQVAVGADGLAGLPSRPGVGGPPPLAVLPPWVDGTALPSSHTATDGGRAVRHLVVGLASDDLGPAAILVPDGDHMLVGGAARTGVSTALERIATAWTSCARTQGSTAARRGVDAVCWNGDAPKMRAVLTERTDVATLLVVDAADRVDDRDGLFAEILRGEHPRVTIVAGRGLDAVRAAYGHWTREVARSRCGLVMTAPGEIDGELLGAVLPRRSVVGHRPGLAWVVDGGGHRLVQVAGRMPA